MAKMEREIKKRWLAVLTSETVSKTDHMHVNKSCKGFTVVSQSPGSLLPLVFLFYHLAVKLVQPFLAFQLMVPPGLNFAIDLR